MKQIFLVDTENVNITALSSANKLSEEDLIILFVTENTNSFQFSREQLKCISTDANILKEASDAVEQLLISDPDLTDDDSRALVNYFKEHTAVNVVDFRTI